MPGSGLSCSLNQVGKHFFVEPIGSKAPSLSSNAESITFKHSVNSSFGLLCQAQAYPVPLIRLVIFESAREQNLIKFDTFQTEILQLFLYINSLMRYFRIRMISRIMM